VNNVENVISQLEEQRSAIDRAISVLREVNGSSATTTGAHAIAQGKTGKRRLSPEGRRRIIEATKKRWAAKRLAEAGTGTKTAAVSSGSRRSRLSAAGRKRLALAMKKRWAAAKRAGKQQLA
jgi:hypothetical protein